MAGKAPRVRLAVIAIGLALFACSCGGGDGSSGKGGSGLRVTREDGSKIELPEKVRAFCTTVVRNESDPDEEPIRQQELWVLGGEFPPEREGRGGPTLWVYWGAAKQLERTPQALLPTDQDLAGLFVFDSKTHNELASDQEESEGMIQVRQWGCNRGDKVRLVVDGTLGSEFFEQPGVAVKGEVETVIGDPLPIPE
jgi:hypothetical protein